MEARDFRKLHEFPKEWHLQPCVTVTQATAIYSMQWWHSSIPIWYCPTWCRCWSSWCPRCTWSHWQNCLILEALAAGWWPIHMSGPWAPCSLLWYHLHWCKPHRSLSRENNRYAQCGCSLSELKDFAGNLFALSSLVGSWDWFLVTKSNWKWQPYRILKNTHKKVTEMSKLADVLKRWQLWDFCHSPLSMLHEKTRFIALLGKGWTVTAKEHATWQHQSGW